MKITANMLATPSFPATLPRILTYPYFRSDSKTLLSLYRKPHAPISSSPDNSHLLTVTATTSDPEISVLSELSSYSNAAIKMPTAPWMKDPIYLLPHEVVELVKPRNRKSSKVDGDEKYLRVFTDSKNDITGKHAMLRIAKSIGKLQKNDNSEGTQMKLDKVEFGDYLEGLGERQESEIRQRMPWEKDERIVFRRIKERTVGAAETSLDKELLKRLRGEASKMGKWVKVKKAGITQAVVDEIKLIWKRNELVMLKFDVPLCRNMDRAREIVELKTGGLVVWSKKNALVVFRGCNYPVSLRLSPNKQAVSSCCPETLLSKQSHMKLDRSTDFSIGKSFESGLKQRIKNEDGEGEEAPAPLLLHNKDFQQMSRSLYERETDRLLDDLGPRFIDWWMHKPLPVDADMLPEVVPGYMPPFRRCHPFAKPKLTDTELLYLRRIAHPLPTHFVLGRNRKLQGLAAAILKLWEKSLIAKIALKWGVLNTNNEQMAYELKNLTGGTLLLRNKFFIILYRGKDFLPVGVTNLIIEREMELQRCQLHEEDARLKASGIICFDDGHMGEKAKAGTLSDFKDTVMNFEDSKTGSKESKHKLEAEKEKIVRELRTQERRLSILNSKIEKSAKELTKLNAWRRVEPDADQEIITNEEKECLRKTGLKMDSILLLGRRGVFDGVIEGLHQHWKHKELVKVITMQRAFQQVIHTAKLLEAESGGILVSVDKLKEGHAIIIYRGKNYRRPQYLASKTLLTKRKALSRSLELQRIGSLKFFANQKRQRISELQLKLENVQSSGGVK